MILKAIKFASIKHANQTRKVSKMPFMVHPIEVMLLLQQENSSDELIVAGILHDTIEDSNTTEKEIKEIFGEKVLSLVLSNTEDKGKSWMERKEYTINQIKHSTRDEKMLLCADKVSNLNSLEEDYAVFGEEMWKSFNGTKEKSGWYYEQIFFELKELAGTKIYERYKKVWCRFSEHRLTNFFDF